MALDGIGGGLPGLGGIGLRQPEGVSARPISGKDKSFEALLEQALGELEGAHAAADEKSLALVSGKDVAIHDVMATVTEAEIVTQLTTAVAAKAIQAYQEIWRMEV
jgi:flagellar hook-basal body complex protein FliE